MGSANVPRFVYKEAPVLDYDLDFSSKMGTTHSLRQSLFSKVHRARSGALQTFTVSLLENSQFCLHFYNNHLFALIHYNPLQTSDQY